MVTDRNTNEDMINMKPSFYNLSQSFYRSNWTNTKTTHNDILHTKSQ